MKLRDVISSFISAFVALAFVVSFQTSAFPNSPKTPTNLTIFSAIALTEPLQALKPIYEQKHSNVTITYNFGASGQLRQQIESGAPADVFISAAQKDMNDLESRNRILKGTRNNLVKNQIVLVVPRGSSGIKSLQDLTRASVKRVAIGNPDTVPIGRYSTEIFKNLNLLEKVSPKFVFGNNVRQVLAYVASGNVDAALVWVTDARTTNQVKIVQRIAENLHSPAIYPIAVVRESQNSEAAKAYVRFLLSSEGKVAFKRYGFISMR